MHDSEPDSLPYPTSITKDELAGLPLDEYRGEIYFIQDDAKLDEVLPVLQKEVVLGFDTETRPAFRKNQRFQPSLLQLATEKEVYLFQLAKLSKTEGLASLLGDSSILKVGVALGHDMKELGGLFPLKARGVFDLGGWAKRYHCRKTGLRNLCGMFLRFRMSKRAQTSNWAKPELSEAQIRYAATDAWVSRELYFYMKDKLGWVVEEL